MRRKSNLNTENIKISEVDICKFCYLDDDETLLFQNDEVYVLPALGSFVSGYVLLIHQDHCDCFAEAMSITTARTKQKLRSLLEEVYQKCIFFEHGRAGGCFDRGNCRIDFHAHLHALPVDVDISDRIAEDFQQIQIDSWHDIVPLAEEYPEYLYFENSNEEQYFYVVEGTAEDQYLRKRVCESIDLPVEYANWRQHPFHDTMIQTIDQLQNRMREVDLQ